MKAWSGRRVARIVALVLRTKGTTCHLCDEPGADSADHDPPRSVLIRSGVADPDLLVYLFPAHLVCNKRRLARALTDDLRRELRARFLGVSTVTTSPRFARRRAELFESADPGRKELLPSLSPPNPENREVPR